MAPLFKSFIPVAFLDAWTRGQYVIGPRTLDYQYAGLALVLRGFYRYDVNWKGSGNDHVVHRFGGYATVYIQDNELNVVGFRMYNTKEGERTPLIWKSIFSRFIDNIHGSTEIYFPYRSFPEVDIGNEIRYPTPSCMSEEGLDRLEDKIMAADQQRASKLPPLLYCTLALLSDAELANKIRAPMVEPKLRGLCMLEAPVLTRLLENLDAKWDLQLKGMNYGVVVGQPIEGTVLFRRLSERFLESIELTRPHESQGC
jgi:hypothetical protein